MKEMPKELQAFGVEPSSSEYDNLRSSCGQEGHPAVIFTPSTNEQVAAVLAYVNALRQDGDECAFSVMSGGHGITKASTNQEASFLISLRCQILLF
ncbi:hypothetical protein [Streptococcus sp. zg-JUN1979]|uniref:hypothetical protein n=1 Tax=Streptococcus sp. zg-JUN1979 TaxID=3391450 RepID=UPI0039A44209